MSQKRFLQRFVGMPALVAISLAACSGDSDGTPVVTATRPALSATAASVPSGVATLRGTLTLDGAPLQTQFLGARVVRDGIAAACQATIPAVSGGAYEIGVVADADVRGCGADGAEIVLWAYAGDRYVYSRDSMVWPGAGETRTFNTAFSSQAPAGATKPATELKGRLYDRNGAQMGGGTVVEAYIGGTLCGVTSLRRGNVTEGYYTLIVAGPQAVAACAQAAQIDFRIGGQAAAETLTNDLRAGGEGHELDLHMR